MPVEDKTSHIRNLTYQVLKLRFPDRLSIREITEDINNTSGEREYSIEEVEYAIRGFAPFCTSFVFIKDPLTGAVSYSVTDINEFFEARNWAGK